MQATDIIARTCLLHVYVCVHSSGRYASRLLHYWHVHVCVFVCLRICVYICMYVSICIYSNECMYNVYDDPPFLKIPGSAPGI